MADFEHEQEVPATEFGQWVRDQYYARMQASAETMMDMLSGGGQTAHQAAHDHITRSTHGIFGAMTGHQLGQAAAEQPVTVGREWGQERVIERNGGLTESIGPAPARVDLTRVNDHPGHQVGESPLMRWARENQ